ncbi:MAG TPA: DNA polymerase III subunit delta [Candidatus Binatia bacterium]|nr:DNA polymerase III subunit delta [Candidatus Binatia bacterium]
MKLTVESILADIRKGAARPLLLLHGDDFKVRSGAQALVDALVPEENRAFNLERFDGRSAPWDQIEAALMTAPFFPGIKAVWVESAPYFASAENKGEIGEKILGLWNDGKKDDAGRALLELLNLEGWSEERWQQAQPRAEAAEVAAVIGDGGRDLAEAILLHARAQNMEIRRGRGEADRLTDLLDNGPPPWGVLLLTADHVDRRTRLYKRFVDKGAALDLAVERDRTGKIDAATLAQFLDRRAAEAGKRIEPRAREMMLARAGTQLWSFHQEVEKLILYIGGAPVIRAEDVEAVVIDQGEGWIFDLTDALTARNTLAALAQVTRLMASDRHPLELVATIATSVRRLLIARQFIDQETRLSKRRMSPDELARNMPEETARMLSKSNPRAVYHAISNAQKFTTKKLARDLEFVYETDFRLKSSNHSPRITMERLILGLCEK